MQKFKAVIDDEELVFQFISLGTDIKLPNVSDVKFIKTTNLFTTVAGMDFECLFSTSIRKRQDTFAIVEPLCLSVTGAITHALLENRTVPICHCEKFTA